MMSTDQSLNQVLRQWVEVYMRRSFRDFRRFMDDTGLSHSQMGALMRLYHCENAGVSDIAGHLGITAPAASQMIDRLVQQGLLERLEDPHDRRFKQLSLTAQGKALIEEGIRARLLWLEDITAVFTPAEQDTIIEVLTLLTDAARQLETERRQP